MVKTTCDRVDLSWVERKHVCEGWKLWFWKRSCWPNLDLERPKKSQSITKTTYDVSMYVCIQYIHISWSFNKKSSLNLFYAASIVSLPGSVVRYSSLIKALKTKFRALCSRHAPRHDDWCRPGRRYEVPVFMGPKHQAPPLTERYFLPLQLIQAFHPKNIQKYPKVE